ncbi:hypothetical protein ACP4OV_015780 [Aristida adscensionis]
MTTFDILIFSPGSNLSGLFDGGLGKERVFVSEPTAVVLLRTEEAGRKAGYHVQREGKWSCTTALVYIEEEGGDIVAKVVAFQGRRCGVRGHSGGYRISARLELNPSTLLPSIHLYGVS